MTRAGLSIPSFGLKVKLMASKGKFERATGQQVTVVKDLLKNSRDFRGFILFLFSMLR